MDKALPSHAGNWGSNPDKTKEDFFLFGKHSNSYPLRDGALSLSLSGLFLQEIMVNLLWGETKERVTWKNPRISVLSPIFIIGIKHFGDVLIRCRGNFLSIKP